MSELQEPRRARRSTLLSQALILASVVLAALPVRAQLQGEQLDRAAAEIDRIWLEELAGRDLQPNEPIDDEQFARRAYLRIAGRIPTLPELDEFLRSRASKSERRQALVDKLLASDAQVSSLFHDFADMLRIKGNLGRRTSGEPYAHFVKQALADNTPFDQFVRELITSEGAAHARGNGSTGYFLRDRGMPHDNMANTARIFLGTRIECAQCHDHPFEDISQQQFYAMSAFTGGLQYRANELYQSETGRSLMQFARKVQQEHGRNGRRAVGRMLQDLGNGISGSGTAADKLPADYQYDDAAPGDVVAAEVLFGEQPDVREPQEIKRRRGRRATRTQGNNRRRGQPQFVQVGSRSAFADWLTSPENERFTTVIVNRMWKRVFGRALIEPLDDMKPDTVSSMPALQSYLDDLMRQCGYDLQAFQAVLMRTQLFGLDVSPNPADGEAFAFTGPALQRARAEQIWDSLITLTRDDPDATLQAPGARAEPVYRRFDNILALDEAGLEALVEREVLRYTNPEKYRAEMRQVRSDAAQDIRERRRELQQELNRRLRPLQRKLRVARRSGRDREVAELTGEMRRIRDELFGGLGDRANRGMVRASELPSPAPEGHFLREFGQSDRETIDNSDDAAEVPQALRLMNSVVDDGVLGPTSAIRTRIDAVKSEKERIQLAYRSILSRAPTSQELRLWLRDYDEYGAETTFDLLWTLVNSHEFRTIL